MAAVPATLQTAPSPRPRTRIAAAVVSTIIVAASLAAAAAEITPLRELPSSAVAPKLQAFSGIPLSFVRNAGQHGASVHFAVHGSRMSTYFTERGSTWRLADGNRGWAIEQEFVGGSATPAGINAQPTRYSWFTGPREEWVTDAPAFSAIRYNGVWPGIDAVYAGGHARMKYRFIVHPGADPSRIELAYRGADLEIGRGGALRVTTPQGTLIDSPPVSYQGVGPDRTEIGSSFRSEGRTIGFDVGPYDRSRPLIIDPMIIYAGFLGGDGDESATSIAVDETGAAYFAGYVGDGSTDFPASVGPDLTRSGGLDAFVAKVAPSGEAFEYVGFIDGAGRDEPSGIAVDASGAAYVAGTTDSRQASFPVTGGPDVTFNGGVDDAFIAKVNPSGTALTYAGYIGGADGDDASGIALDASGAAYLTGSTSSRQATFPVTGGPDLTYNGGSGDAFVAKVSPSGDSLEYATYLGGSGSEGGKDIALDAEEAAYLVGNTDSRRGSFPVIAGPDLTYNGGGWDGYVAKVAPDGSSLEFAGYVGGDDSDEAFDVAVDAAGATYLTGYTESSRGFPTVIGPDLNRGEVLQAHFITKVDPSGTSLTYSGYLPGEGAGVAVDETGAAILVGTVDQAAGDMFIAKVSPSGDAMTYSGFIGSKREPQAASDVALDGAGAAYVVGGVNDFAGKLPVAAGPDLTYNGGVNGDAFVAKLDVATIPALADVRIGDASERKMKGNDIWNPHGTHQIVTRRVRSGRAAAFDVAIQNDGTQSDAFRFKGCTRRHRLRVTFSEAGTDITAAVEAGTYVTRELALGERLRLSIKIRPRRSVRVGSQISCGLLATSVNDPLQRDKVRAVVEVRGRLD